MARFVKFVTGTSLSGLHAEISDEAIALTSVMTQGVLHAFLALTMFEPAYADATRERTHDDWKHNVDLQQAHEERLAAEDPREISASDYFEWKRGISGEAKSEVLREKWAAGELPDELKSQLAFLHAQTFVAALAQVERAFGKLAKMDLGGAEVEVRAACDGYEAAVPSLKAVRDSVEHAEDRRRGLNRHGQKMTLAPITNTWIDAPGGGVLVAGALRGTNLAWTVDDGSYREVEVSDATIESARAAVQRALDALPWEEHGYPRHVPSS
jgi:hypothetical protein